MDLLRDLIGLYDDLAYLLSRPQGWWQLSVLLLAGGSAWLVNHYWKRRISSARRAQHGLARITLGGGERLLFPFTFLGLLLFGRSLLHGIGHDIGLLQIAVPLLWSLAAIRLGVYLLRKGFNPSEGLKAWESSFATLIWAAVALHILGWLEPLLDSLDAIAFTLGTTRVSVLSVLQLLLSVALFLLLALWLAALIERRLEASAHLNSGTKAVLGKLARMVLIVLALLFALEVIGIDLTALTVFGGALGVGLGFGLQRIASNFISGFILLFDRSIRPGDVISIGNSYGWVSALRARYVVVKDRDGVERLIPNENLITTEVINWSYSDRNVRLKIPVQVSYNDDPELAMSLLEAAANANPRVLQDPPPAARLVEFGDNGIGLELRAWVNDPEEGLTNIRSELNLAIWRAFKQHGVTIPYPQRDVHVYQK